MELIPLNCNHCGAKLKVREDTRFVTCKHCDTQLAVRHEDGAAFTDVVEAAKRMQVSAEAIGGHVEKLGDHSDRLFVQGEIERLDREWQEKVASWMMSDRHGRPIIPTRRNAIALALTAPLVLFPLLLPSMFGFSWEIPVFAWFLVFALIGLVLFMAARSHANALAYERSLAHHQREREELVGRLAALAPSAARAAKKPKKKKKADAGSLPVGGRGA